MSMTFTKATKSKAKLRLALFGPSGSGKTFTALRLANGMGGAVALIDTERGSASKYADRFAFDVLDLDQKDIDTYIQAIRVANGYPVLIIDSLSHAWEELLTEVDKLANAKYKGNTWSAWSEGTPKQRSLVEAILAFPGHIVATMRSETEWAVENGSNGKIKPIRIGLKPRQGKGIEYEFDMLIEISPDHIANVIKDRTGKYQDKIFDKPGEDLGKELNAWLLDGTSTTSKDELDVIGERLWPGKWMEVKKSILGNFKDDQAQALAFVRNRERELSKESVYTNHISKAWPGYERLIPGLREALKEEFTPIPALKGIARAAMLHQGHLKEADDMTLVNVALGEIEVPAGF